MLTHHLTEIRESPSFYISLDYPTDDLLSACPQSVISWTMHSLSEEKIVRVPSLAIVRLGNQNGHVGGYLYVSFCFKHIVFQTHWPQGDYLAQNDLELLAFLLLPPECWDSGPVPPCLSSAALFLSGKHTNWATSPAVPLKKQSTIIFSMWKKQEEPGRDACVSVSVRSAGG